MQNALQAIIPIFQRSSFLVVFLMSVFSANKSCHEIMYHHKIHIQALQHLLISIKDEENEAVYYLRIICNCVCQESNMMVKELVEDHSHTLKECVKHLFESSKDYLKKECLILLGNLVNHPVHTFSNFGTELMNENSEAIVNIVKKEREDNLLTSEMILLNDE